MSTNPTTVSSGNNTGNVELKSIKTIKFTGDENEWKEWNRKVQAYFRQKGWITAIENESAATDEQKANALNFLVMSMSGVAFAFVQDATSAQAVWDELRDEYEPNEDSDIYDLQESFTKCLLKS